jgi:hypothetical protein
MKTTPKHPLQFDSLESRTYLSAGLQSHITPTVVIEKAKPVKPARPITVSGLIAGSYSVANQLIVGSGNVSPLGTVTLVGSTAGIVGSPGSRISAPVTLITGQGTLTLGLMGVVPRALGKAIAVSVVIEGGTGSYLHDTGSGVGTIQPRNVSADLTSGSFSFTLHASLKTG